MANENMAHAEIAAEALRDALKDVESTVTSALAHQPEDEAKCGQFLYDALVKCFNIADLACHAARTESGAAVSREEATAENSSAVGNVAKLREALLTFVRAYEQTDEMANIEDTAEAYELARAALATPSRNCDVYNKESCRMAYHLHGDGLMTMQAFADWLFAPDRKREHGS